MTLRPVSPKKNSHIVQQTGERMVIALRRRLTSLLSVFAAIGLVLMMSHIVINAILRFSFNSPISGTNEIVEYWYLPFVALVGIPAAQLNREQISVNILTERMSVTTARIFAWFVMAVAVIFSLGAAWFGLQAALGQASISATGGVTNILVWPAYFLVPMTFTLLGIIFIADMTSARSTSGAARTPDTAVQESHSATSTAQHWATAGERRS